MSKKTKQDKHKHSVFTAADNIKYRQYVNKQMAKGEPAMDKGEWRKKKK